MRFSVDPGRLAAVQAASQFAQGASSKLLGDANAAAARRHALLQELEFLRAKRSNTRGDRAEIDGQIEAVETKLEAADREVERTRREAEVQSEVRNQSMRLADACRAYAERNT